MGNTCTHPEKVTVVAPTLSPKSVKAQPLNKCHDVTSLARSPSSGRFKCSSCDVNSYGPPGHTQRVTIDHQCNVSHIYLKCGNSLLTKCGATEGTYKAQSPIRNNHNHIQELKVNDLKNNSDSYHEQMLIENHKNLNSLLSLKSSSQTKMPPDKVNQDDPRRYLRPKKSYKKFHYESVVHKDDYFSTRLNTVIDGRHIL